MAVPTRTEHTLEELPSWAATTALGTFAFLLPILGLAVPSMAGMRAYDIPVSGVLFLWCAVLCVRARHRHDGVLVGLLLCAVGVTIALFGLVLDHLHPWWP